MYIQVTFNKAKPMMKKSGVLFKLCLFNDNQTVMCSIISWGADLIWKTKEIQKNSLRESSFNMTGRGDKDIEGELWKFLDTRKGALKNIGGGGPPKICILLTQKEGGLLKNWAASEGGY